MCSGGLYDESCQAKPNYFIYFKNLSQWVDISLFNGITHWFLTNDAAVCLNLKTLSPLRIELSENLPNRDAYHLTLVRCFTDSNKSLENIYPPLYCRAKSGRSVSFDQPTLPATAWQADSDICGLATPWRGKCLNWFIWKIISYVREDVGIENGKLSKKDWSLCLDLCGCASFWLFSW